LYTVATLDGKVPTPIYGSQSHARQTVSRAQRLLRTPFSLRHLPNDRRRDKGPRSIALSLAPPPLLSTASVTHELTLNIVQETTYAMLAQLPFVEESLSQLPLEKTASGHENSPFRRSSTPVIGEAGLLHFTPCSEVHTKKSRLEQSRTPRVVEPECCASPARRRALTMPQQRTDLRCIPSLLSESQTHSVVTGIRLRESFATLPVSCGLPTQSPEDSYPRKVRSPAPFPCARSRSTDISWSLPTEYPFRYRWRRESLQ